MTELRVIGAQEGRAKEFQLWAADKCIVTVRCTMPATKDELRQLLKEAFDDRD